MPVKQCPTGGQLTIITDLSEDGEAIEIRFIDTGVGIPAAYLNKIFDPFFTPNPQEQVLG